MQLRTTATALLVGALALAGCGDETGPEAGGEQAEASEPAGEGTEGQDTGGGAPVSAGRQLGAWPEEAAELLPLPDTLDLSTASPNEQAPAFRGSSDEAGVDEVASDIDALLGELGWQDVERTEDNAEIRWTAEHDDWSADFYVSPKDDGTAFAEGGMTAK